MILDKAVEFGNKTYIFFVILCIILFVVLFTYFKRMNKEKVRKIILIWMFVNFALHFLKQLVYRTPSWIEDSFLDNICAITTVILPFVYLTKKHTVIKDWCFFIGVLGGIAAILAANISHVSFEIFEVSRYYFCHFTIFSAPLFLAIFNIDRPRLISFVWVPLCLLVYQLIIMGNTAIIVFSGLGDTKGNYTHHELFWSTTLYNHSMTFGPVPGMGFLNKVFDALTLPIMKKDLANVNGGATTYWPVIWLIGPAIFIFAPLYILSVLPFFIIELKKKKKTKSVSV